MRIARRPVIALLPLLLAAVSGCDIVTADLKAHETAEHVFGQRVTYAADPWAAVQGADALCVVTEWLVYRTPDFDKLRGALKRPLIIDGRNLWDPARMAQLGFEYHGIGRRRA